MAKQLEQDGPFKEFATNCRFCHKPITIKIAESYLAFRDPYKLLPMAACNACADIRNWRHSLEEKITRHCNYLERFKGQLDSDQLKKSAEKLEPLLKEYARLISRWHVLDGVVWHDDVVPTVMENPRQFPLVLKGMWDMFEQSLESRRTQTQ